MTVALDASLWDEPTTGIGLYTRSLYRGLVEIPQQVQRVGARRSGEVPRNTPSRTGWMLGELPRYLKRERPAVFHAVSNFNLPLQKPAGMRFVLTVHDLIPLLLPNTVSTAFRMQFRVLLARSVSLADAVVCISEATRSSLGERFPEHAAKMHVVHNGVDHVFDVPRPDPITLTWFDTLGLPSRFALYAGAIDARKNIEGVLDACESLSARGTPLCLVIAGQAWYGTQAVRKRIGTLRAKGVDIRPLGFVHETVLYELMRRARVFVFPSRYEGFGLPPLEAMALGTPAIVAPTGALPEVCGDAATYVPLDQPELLADAMHRLATDDLHWKKRADAGRLHAKRFTWEACAKQTAALYSP